MIIVLFSLMLQQNIEKINLADFIKEAQSCEDNPVKLREFQIKKLDKQYEFTGYIIKINPDKGGGGNYWISPEKNNKRAIEGINMITAHVDDKFKEDLDITKPIGTKIKIIGTAYDISVLNIPFFINCRFSFPNE